MPWCEHCARFLSPNTVRSDGTCPVCGSNLGGAVATSTAATHPAVPAGGGPDGVATSGDAEVGEDYKAPWHFKLMVVMAVIYLTWRLVQLATWLI